MELEQLFYLCLVTAGKINGVYSVNWTGTDGATSKTRPEASRLSKTVASIFTKYMRVRSNFSLMRAVGSKARLSAPFSPARAKKTRCARICCAYVFVFMVHKNNHCAFTFVCAQKCKEAMWLDGMYGVLLGWGEEKQVEGDEKRALQQIVDLAMALKVSTHTHANAHAHTHAHVFW